MDMSNIAYTSEYQEKRQKWDVVFAPENLQETEEFFRDGYTFIRNNYQGKKDRDL